MAYRFRLGDLLRERALSQSELARRAKVTFQAVNHLCSGRARGVTFDMLNRLADALGVQPGELFEREKVAPRGKRGR